MIPLKLQIKNFLSYGPQTQTIDFTAHHLICLTGRNGHGKSALLDAITWALWGQARKVGNVSKPDEGILRLGQSSMMVSLDFRVRDVEYRVRREFTITGSKAASNLDIGVIEPETGRLRGLTDKTIRATQEVITSIIGLDYDTFVNSAFLRQGQSNEFSKKSPKERKEVLASILGLNRYEDLKKAALDKIRVLNTDREHRRLTCTDLQAQLLNREKLAATHNVLCSAMETLSKQIATGAQQEEALVTHRTLCDVHLLEDEKLRLKGEHSALIYQSTVARILELATAWRNTHRMLRRARHSNGTTHMRTILADLEARSLQRTKLVEQLFALKSEEQRLKSLAMIQARERIDVLRKTAHQLYEARVATERDTALLDAQLQELRSKIAASEKEQATVVTQIATLTQMSKTLVKESERFERRKAWYHAMTAQGTARHTELKQIMQRHTLMTHEESPSCPLCEQNVSAGRRRYMLASFERRAHLLNHQITRLSRVLTTLKDALVTDHARISAQTTADHERATCEKKLHELRTIHTQLVHTISDRETVYARLSAQCIESAQRHATAEQVVTAAEQTIEQDIARHPAYHACTTALIQHEKELAELAYDPVQHAMLKEQAGSVITYDEIDRLITENRARGQAIHELIVTAKKIQRESKEITVQRKQYATALQEQRRIDEELKQIRALRAQLAQTQSERIAERATIEQQLAHLQSLQERMAQYEREEKELAQKIQEYSDLAHAVGKDGIQALLIEESIPEIEEEANYLLTKLTDNQAHLSIESLRDLKSGATKETLDIKISDAMGIRAYELFSGGEAFRIDLALRIALSKLLARRAGATLQTLIIDEGFGSQDEEGIAHIMEALYKIQDDFSKIIIVSHMPSMKDQFPVHIAIHKGTQGSTARVIEQG